MTRAILRLAPCLVVLGGLLAAGRPAAASAQPPPDAAEHGAAEDATFETGHHGAGHEPPRPEAALLVRHGVNLAALLAILGFALRVPVSDFLKFRRQVIKERLDASFRAKVDAEEEHARLIRRRDGLDAEVEAMLRAAQQDARAERERILEQARKAAADLEASARRTVEEEARRARVALRDEIVQRALEQAEGALAQAHGPLDAARLHAEYIEMASRAVGALEDA